MKKLLCILAVICLMLLVGCPFKSREAVVGIGPNLAKVIAEAVPSDYKDVHTIGELAIGDTALVLDVKYFKECCKVCQIELSDGRKGWVTAGDNCDVIFLK